MESSAVPSDVNFKLEDKEYQIGAKLQCYAGGGGCLSNFIRQNQTTKEYKIHKNEIDNETPFRYF